jgi:hypothetical protein
VGFSADNLGSLPKPLKETSLFSDRFLGVSPAWKCLLLDIAEQFRTDAFGSHNSKSPFNNSQLVQLTR